MLQLFFNCCGAIFGNNLMEEAQNWITAIMNALTQILSVGEVSNLLALFTSIAGSLLIIYFFMNLANDVTKDIMTLERLLLNFIKLLIAMVILIYLPDIVSTLFSVAKGVYDVCSQGLQSRNANMFTYNFGDGLTFQEWPEYSDVKDVINQSGNEWKTNFGFGVSKIAKHMGIFILALVTWLLSFVAKLVVAFVAASNAIMVIVRVIYTPLAVVQCFEDGTRSAGILWLKKLLASMLTFACIIGILWASGYLCATVLNNMSGIPGEVTADTLKDTLENGGHVFISIIAVQLASVGAIIKAPQLAGDICGVR